MNLLKLLFLPLYLFTTLGADAQRWSYIYIQGDKQIPFYVKLEGEMLPRYSKNYYIIPQLEAGPIHLQVLFQQNEFPAQNFNVLVPEAGSRGFLLTRKDNTFALYDIQQRFYLYPGDNGEDHLPEMISLNTAKEKPNPLPKDKNIVKQPEKPASKSHNEKDSPEPIASTGDTSDEPKFIEDIILNNDHSNETVQRVWSDNEMPEAEVLADDVQSEPIPVSEEPQQSGNIDEQYSVAEEVSNETGSDMATSPDYMQEQVEIESHTAPIINSDCPQPLSEAEFDKIYSNTKDKSDDEKRVSYLMKKAENNCFTSRQAYFLAREMKAESMRYSFLKKAYPRITDQHNFHLLEDHLFRTLEWKSYFRLIYQ